MKSILYGIPNLYDACSFYRGLGPFSHLRKVMPLQLTPLNNLNWTVAAHHDILFLLRPNTEEHKNLVVLAKKLGMKVWVDYDDDVLHVPDSNPAHAYYSQAKVESSIRCILSIADVVTVSTKAISEVFNRFHKKGCIAIPNAFPDNWLTFDDVDAPRNKIITWRGSNTHEADLQLAHNFFIQTQNSHPEYEFVFLGEPDYRTRRLFKRPMKVYPPIGIDDYFPLLKSLNPAFHIVPLEDNLFNRSKSNIAWLEATYAGAMTIASPLPEWNLPFKICNDFDLSSAEIFRDDYVLESKAFIKEHLMLSRVNQMRQIVIETLA